MALTRPTINNINTTVSSLIDPLIVVNRDSTAANVDIGFVFNRDGGSASNVAVIWDETNNQFALGLTSNSGIVNSNVTISSYANLRAGGIIANSIQTDNFTVDESLTIGSQIIYAQGTNGFSVNEDFDPSNSSTQTAYHFTSGAGRETVAFTLARTAQFTDGFGIYGTSSDNKFVMFGEQSNTSWEWRKGVGIRPLDLDGGTLVANLSAAGNFTVSGNITAGGVTGNLIPSANLTYSLGDSTHWWSSLYVSGSTIYLGGIPLTISDGALSVNNQAVGGSLTGVTDNATGSVLTLNDTNIKTTRLDVRYIDNSYNQSSGEDLSILTFGAFDINIKTNQFSSENAFRIDATTGTDIRHTESSPRIQTQSYGTEFLNGVIKLPVRTSAPSTPANGMIGIADGTSWNPVSTGAQSLVGYIGNAWVNLGASGGATFTANADAPSGPAIGDLWYETDTDILFQRINDGTSNVWVDISTQTIAAEGVYGNSNVASFLSNVGSNSISTTGNVTANSFIGDGSALTNLPASGKILQVVSTTKTDTTSGSSTSWTDITGLSVSITPSATSSKILLLASIYTGSDNAGSSYHGARLTRDGTAIGVGDAASSRSQVTSWASHLSHSNVVNKLFPVTMNYLDSPSTTSATTYKVQMAVLNSGDTWYINRSATDTDIAYSGRAISTLTAIEVSA